MRDKIYNTLKRYRARLYHVTFDEICDIAGVERNSEEAWKALNELSEMGMIKSYVLDDGAMRIYVF